MPFTFYKRRVAQKQLKRVYKKRKAYGAGYIVSKVMNNKIHTFHRMTKEFYIWYNAGIKIAASDGSGAVSFVNSTGSVATAFTNYASVGVSCLHRLSDVINSTEFTALFDSYRFKWVKTRIDYMNANNFTSDAINVNASLIPEIYSVLDYDDAVAPTTQDQILQYEGCKIKKLEQSKTFKRNFRPRASLEAFKTSGTGIGFIQSSKDQWLDCSYPDIEHYGHKFWINNIWSGAGNDLPAGNAVRIQMEYCFEFKTVR